MIEILATTLGVGMVGAGLALNRLNVITAPPELVPPKPTPAEEPVNIEKTREVCFEFKTATLCPQIEDAYSQPMVRWF